MLTDFDRITFLPESHASASQGVQKNSWDYIVRNRLQGIPAQC